MAKPPSYEFATLDKLPDNDADTEIVVETAAVGLYPSGPSPREESPRSQSPMPGSLDPDTAIDRTTPTPVMPRRFAGIEPSYPPAGAHPYSQAQGRDSPPVWHTQQNTTVVVHQPVPLPHLAQRPGPVSFIGSCEDPTPTVCYNCKESIVTYIYKVSGNCTYASCVILAMVGCACGCCLVPFFVDQFKDTIHKCPNCHVILGKYRKL